MLCCTSTFMIITKIPNGALFFSPPKLLFAVYCHNICKRPCHFPISKTKQNSNQQKLNCLSQTTKHKNKQDIDTGRLLEKMFNIFFKKSPLIRRKIRLTYWRNKTNKKLLSLSMLKLILNFKNRF